MSVKKIHDSSTNLEKMFCLHQKDWKETLQGFCDIKKKLILFYFRHK
jgi:hypothetical protein